MAEFRSRWLDWTPDSRDKPEPEPPPSSADESPPTPFARLESDWAAAWGRAQEGFAVHGISPTHETLQAVTVLELWIADGGPPRRGLSVEDLESWTSEIYRGRGSARVSADGRVVLRALGNNEQGETR